jgi:hypothetical protein
MRDSNNDTAINGNLVHHPFLDEHIAPLNRQSTFDEYKVLHGLKHYLPAQAPLKDFIHHNTLHAFQHKPFFEGLNSASEIFGYKVQLSLDEYRQLFHDKRIREDVLRKVVIDRKGPVLSPLWLNKMLNEPLPKKRSPRIGILRSHWKRQFKIDLDSLVHPTLFRVLGAYLDQGISMWSFPVGDKSFLEAMRELDNNSYFSLFQSKRARKLLRDSKNCTIANLLEILVFDEGLYEQYLFDQQFAHQGWSGMVSTVEDQPETMIDRKKISLHDLIVFELLLEIDALDTHFGEIWSPLGPKLKAKPRELFAPVQQSELQEVLEIWQEVFEWSYYDQVLAGVQMSKGKNKPVDEKSFQAMFCIDDRECSLRRYIEKLDPQSETFGTPGFFGVEFYFRPEHAKYLTKLCPAPVTPKFLIKEQGCQEKEHGDIHFSKGTSTLLRGWLASQTLGFWAAIRLIGNIFRPQMSATMASSFRQMDHQSQLSIVNQSPDHHEHGLQVGFQISEMADRVEGLLKSTGLVRNFATIVYVVGHGSSSVNNPHYSAYDCGACSGRPGSVNARVISFMANHSEVRALLRERGIDIPVTTQFIGGLHDTTRDEIQFFDEKELATTNLNHHQHNLSVFHQALDLNAKERSRRFESINTNQREDKIHEQIKIRSVSVFEPRPELNHATNALCIVGRRSLSQGLFLDRRSFLNSFDYEVDPDGKYLFNILKAVAPVCGGINLEYFFSRVDNNKLGAGTKLPHNVMGLIGVANGIDGDLRPGLPSQMIEVHDPVRLLVIVEHYPQVILNTIQRDAATYEWFKNQWVRLACVDPETRSTMIFDGAKEQFKPYEPIAKTLQTVIDVVPVLQRNPENLPVYLIA